MRGTNAAELVADVERKVSEGILQPGDRLPPVRRLAEELILAPNTVAAAYRRLGERGIVVGRGRNGTFIAPRPPVATPVEPEITEGLVDLALGNPDPALLPDFGLAPRGDPVLYGHESFDQDLHKLAASSFASDDVPPDHLSVVSGALDGLERILSAHLRAGDRVAIEDPAFFSVIDLLGALGLIPVPVAIDDIGLQPEPLARAVESGISAIVHTPRGQNPFGSAMSEARRDDLVALIGSAPDVLIVEDDFASVVSGAPYVTIAGQDRSSWAVMRSAAKTFAPDLRLAYFAADETTVRRVEGRQRLGPGWVSHMLQRTVAGLMDDPSVARQLNEAAGTYAARRVALIDALAAQGIASHGRSGLNVWIPVDDEQLVVSEMRDRGFAVRAGDRFRLRAAPGIRVTTAALPVDQASGVADALSATLGQTSHSGRSA